MKLFNYKHISAGGLFILIFFMHSCKSYLDVDAPINQVPSEQAFMNDAAALSSVLGIYGNSNLLATNGSLEYSLIGSATALGGMSADDIYYYAGTYLDDVKNNNIQPSLGYLNNVWNYAYAEIYNCNAAIEGLTNSQGVSETVKQQLLGEVYFLRAFTYFYLTNLFGDVPLVTSTVYSQNISLSRTPQTAVYTQMIADLQTAQNLLNETYASDMHARANKLVASALLARVYLYLKDYANAEIQSSSVISSPLYNLEPLDAVFTNTSNEVIWQRATYYGYTVFGNNFVPGSSPIPNYVLYPTLAASFEEGDQRLTTWTGTYSSGNETLYYPYKYKLRTATAGNEYAVMMRLAEQYLIRAEARAQLGKVTGTESAAEDLNTVRERAGLSPTLATAQEAMLLAIEQERSHELFSELGHRWFDLKRTGRAEVVLSPIKPNFTSTSLLFPVPQQQIASNPALDQNPGYN